MTTEGKIHLKRKKKHNLGNSVTSFAVSFNESLKKSPASYPVQGENAPALKCLMQNLFFFFFFLFLSHLSFSPIFLIMVHVHLGFVSGNCG